MSLSVCSSFRIIHKYRFLYSLNISRCISSSKFCLKSKNDGENGAEEINTNPKFNETNAEKLDLSSDPNISREGQTSQFNNSSSNQEQNNTFNSYDDDEINSQILNVALQFVPKFGWTVTSIDEAIKSLDLSVAATGIFRRGAIDLVLHFIEECNKSLSIKLSSIAEKRLADSSSTLSQSEFIEFAVKSRLEMIIPYIETWPQAMKLMASPMAATECIQLGAHLMDEIWYYAGDTSTDMSWYSKRATLSAIYIATEIYMLNDKSKDFADTWTFLHNRMSEVKQLEKCKHSFEEFLSGSYSFVCASVTTAQNIMGLNNRSRR